MQLPYLVLGNVGFFSEMLVAVLLRVRGWGGKDKRLLRSAFRGCCDCEEVAWHLVQRRVFSVVEFVLDGPSLERPVALHQDLARSKPTCQRRRRAAFRDIVWARVCQRAQARRRKRREGEGKKRLFFKMTKQTQPSTNYGRASTISITLDSQLYQGTQKIQVYVGRWLFKMALDGTLK